VVVGNVRGTSVSVRSGPELRIFSGDTLCWNMEARREPEKARRVFTIRRSFESDTTCVFPKRGGRVGGPNVLDRRIPHQHWTTAK
jgi:hypothetical protein